MGEYTFFIEAITKNKEYRGANFIQYADGGGELYISFQTLLIFLNDYVNLNYGDTEETATEPVVGIDWTSDKPFFAYSTSVSFDLLKCYLYNATLGTSDGTFYFDGVYTFHPFTFFTTEINDIVKEEEELEVNKKIIALQKDFENSDDYETVVGKGEGNTKTVYRVYPTIGNINYIYLNVGYLAQLIVDGSDNPSNELNIRKFLQDICDGVGKALGGINDFQVIVDDDTNELTIVDFNQKRIKGLVDIQGEKTTIFRAQGLGSMLTDLQVQSNITPEIAATISIGAQVNGNQLGVEATSFSRLSEGLTDRIYPAKIIGKPGNVNDGVKKPDGNTMFENVSKAYVEVIKNQIEKGDTNTVVFKSQDKLNLENICTELYKALLGKFTIDKKTAATFIPLRLNITMPGISGIKIFQRFGLTGDVLPYNYKDDFDFIVTGITHDITNNNTWTTKISAITILKEK